MTDNQPFDPDFSTSERRTSGSTTESTISQKALEAGRVSLLLSTVAMLFFPLLAPWALIRAKAAAKLGADTSVSFVFAVIGCVLLVFFVLGMIFLLVAMAAGITEAGSLTPSGPLTGPEPSDYMMGGRTLQ